MTLEYSKQFKLITPEKAASLGVVTDEPVTVSPIIKNSEICRHCNATYSPLVYSRRIITMTQHFHPKFDHGGGIYIFHNFGIIRLGSYCGKGVFGEVRTIGGVVQTDKYEFKTKAVEVLNIHVISSNSNNDIIELMEGVLVHDNLHSGVLYPMEFEEAARSKNEAYCNFKVSPEDDLTFYDLDSSQNNPRAE